MTKTWNSWTSLKCLESLIGLKVLNSSFSRDLGLNLLSVLFLYYRRITFLIWLEVGFMIFASSVTYMWFRKHNLSFQRENLFNAWYVWKFLNVSKYCGSVLLKEWLCCSLGWQDFPESLKFHSFKTFSHSLGPKDYRELKFSKIFDCLALPNRGWNLCIIVI